MVLQRSPPSSKDGKMKTMTSLQSSKADSPKHSYPSPASAKASYKSVFTRSLGAYFPRSSAQVQPKPAPVAELLRLVEELRERECLFKTELLELKLLKESAAIVPLLENQIYNKDASIQSAMQRIDFLQEENQRIRAELDLTKLKLEEEENAHEKKVKGLEALIAQLKGTITECNDELSRFHDANFKIIPVRNARKLVKIAEISLNRKHEFGGDYKNEEQVDKNSHSSCSSGEIASECALTSVINRAPRVPRPPPKPSSSILPRSSSPGRCSSSSDSRASIPPLKLVPPPPKSAPPPPPPPPSKMRKALISKVKRAPEVVELYHALMRRDSCRRESGAGVCEASSGFGASTRDMIGEIENRSAHLLAIKTDVEVQGDFVRFLITEVENAAFAEIEDVLPFVKWLDEELSYLIDERAVLKHFQWPERKADALREAAFGFSDFKKLENEASSFNDDFLQPCCRSLKKMQALFEKLEHGVYNLSRMRESATNRYKELQIPTNWMLESGLVSQLKLASVKLAMKYMKRVSARVEMMDGGGLEEEELIVQGVKFAFRVHQFAGGFDTETMRAFEELRGKASVCHLHCQNQQEQKLTLTRMGYL